MATAPRPGVSERLEIEATQSEMMDSGLHIICKADGPKGDVEILLGDLSSEDEIACLNEIGQTPAQLMTQGMGITTVLVFYWLALRQVRQKDPPKLTKILRKYGTPRRFVEAGFEVFGIGAMAADEDEDGPSDSEEGEERLDPSTSDAGSVTPCPDGPSSTDSTPGTSEDLPS